MVFRALHEQEGGAVEYPKRQALAGALFEGVPSLLIGKLLPTQITGEDGGNGAPVKITRIELVPMVDGNVDSQD